jgi:hypothetical protein
MTRALIHNVELHRPVAARPAARLPLGYGLVIAAGASFVLWAGAFKLVAGLLS